MDPAFGRIAQNPTLGSVLLSCLIALAGPAVRAQQPSSQYQLAKQWEVTFESLMPLLSRGFALCPSGSAYVAADQQGTLKSISSDGKVTVESAGKIASPTDYMACDAKDQLYVADGEALSIWNAIVDGSLALVSRNRTKVHFGRFLAAPDGSLYDMTVDAQGRPLVRLLSSEGKVLHSFPMPSAHLGVSAPSIPASLSWDADPQGVIITFQDSSRIARVDSAGHWSFASFPGVRDPTPSFTLPGVGGSSFLRWCVFSYPDGQYVAQEIVTTEFEFSTSRVRKLLLLDGSFQTVWYHESPDGFLVGTSEDGGLYFLGGGVSNRFAVVRYKLTLSDSNSQN